VAELRSSKSRKPQYASATSPEPTGFVERSQNTTLPHTASLAAEALSANEAAAAAEAELVRMLCRAEEAEGRNEVLVAELAAATARLVETEDAANARVAAAAASLRASEAACLGAVEAAKDAAEGRRRAEQSLAAEAASAERAAGAESAAAAAAKKAEAEEAARAAEAEADKAKVKKSDAEEIQLELPPPGKGMKDALLKIKDIADDDFNKKYKLANAGGNKLAKMKYKDFQTLFEEFASTASAAQKAAFVE